MESHTPKREAIERFVHSHQEHAPGWQIAVVDEHETPLVRLQASSQKGSTGGPKTLEIHTRQVTLTRDRLDESTQKMIERWLDSLVSGGRH